MKTLLLLVIATLAFGQETYQVSKAVESNDVSQAASEQVHPVEPEVAPTEDKKLGKRSHGWIPWVHHGGHGHGLPWHGGYHGGHGGHYGGYSGHGVEIIHGGYGHGGYGGHGYGHGGYGGHGDVWYGGWYPGYEWPLFYSHGSHGGHGWHGKW